MKYQDRTPGLLRRPSVFVPVLLALVAVPAAIVGGCGSSNSGTNTDTNQFTSIPSTPVSLTLGWPDATPNPTTSPTAKPNPLATPPYTFSTPAPNTPALLAPASARSAVLTLSSSDPNTGSVLVFPAINRDDSLPGTYFRTYVSEQKARTGTTNANVRFYDGKDGKGNAIADSTKLTLTINSDGTSLTGLLPSPSVIATLTPTPSPSP